MRKRPLPRFSIAQHEPDAVLLDLKLPDSDDLSLLASVRRLVPGVPGHPDDRIRHAAKCSTKRARLGVFTVLDKPFDLDELEQVVERALVTTRPS